VTPQWTIAVWIGNFTGEGNNNLSGAKSAAPLMFDIFNYLPKKHGNNWFKRPDRHMVPVTVCRDTGFAAGENCDHKVAFLSPGTARSLTQCPYHKRLFVTKDERHQVCSLCWEPGNYKLVKRLLYPAVVSQYLRDSGVILSSAPPHLRECSCVVSGGRNPLQIIYPVHNAKLWIPRDFGQQLQYIAFRAAHVSRHSSVYWYIDNVYKGSTKGKHKLVSRLGCGWHRLEIVDDQGNRKARKFYVSVLNQVTP
jgi:penicillin-binding protein 1C